MIFQILDDEKNKITEIHHGADDVLIISGDGRGYRIIPNPRNDESICLHGSDALPLAMLCYCKDLDSIEIRRLYGERLTPKKEARVDYV